MSTYQVNDYNRNTYNSYGSVTPPAGQHDPRYPIQASDDPTLRRSRFRELRQDPRFDSYHKKINEYKYNIYSVIDEPWNRCCEVGKCGTCPGN